MKSKTTIFATDAELGEAAAGEIFAGIQNAYLLSKNYVLGCPGGRSPRTTYRALARLVAVNRQSLQHLHIAMMDEYVAQLPDGEFGNVDANSHFSCHRFAFNEIRDVLNAGLKPDLQIPYEQVLVPEAHYPAKYENKLRSLGVDCFLLASGASDGHVAFNGRGTDRKAVTRVAALADETRTDNLQTFPNFSSLAEVPKLGVTVGPETITAVSKSAIMLLQGEHKRQAYNQISSAEHYDPNWPATIIAECRNPQIFADFNAANSI